MAQALPSFIANPSLAGREAQYVALTVKSAAVLKSWKLSLFSYEWLLPDGQIRPVDDLPLKEREKRLQVEDALKRGIPLMTPVLGIGIMDNIEIGSGRDVFLTLSALGYDHIPVYAPKSCLKEFKSFQLS
jgi:hypothetical protein